MTAKQEQKDTALIAHLEAYEEFLTSQLELQTVLREGFFGLAKARRDLSRSRNTGTPSVGALQFPEEIEATARVAQVADADTGRVELRIVCRAPGAAAPSCSKATVGGGAAGAAEQAAAHEAQLEQLGVAGELRSEIASALSGGDGVGMTCGDSLVVEGPDGGARLCSLSSPISMAPSGIQSLKDARFASLVNDAGAEAAETTRAASQRPSAAGDPVRWFSVMPPPSLRKSQASFQRSLELMVHLANLNARMEAESARYDAAIVSSS